MCIDKIPEVAQTKVSKPKRYSLSKLILMSGWIGLGDGFGPPQLGVGDMAKILYHNFLFLFFISRLMILSQFFVMLVFLLCKLAEHYSQTNFPIIKTAF